MESCPEPLVEQPDGSLLAELECGLAGGELRVWIQPLAGPHSQVCEAFEALVWWQHPTRGLLSLGAFIDSAEQSLLMGPLIDQVLDVALAECVRWRAAGHMIPVSVNISRWPLRDEGLPERIRHLLDQFGVPRHAVTAGVTESAVFGQPDAAYELLPHLRASGVGLSIDDFGTWHASSMMLMRVTIDKNKIERVEEQSVKGIDQYQHSSSQLTERQTRSCAQTL